MRDVNSILGEKDIILEECVQKWGVGRQSHLQGAWETVTSPGVLGDKSHLQGCWETSPGGVGEGHISWGGERQSHLHGGGGESRDSHISRGVGRQVTSPVYGYTGLKCLKTL